MLGPNRPDEFPSTSAHHWCPFRPRGSPFSRSATLRPGIPNTWAAGEVAFALIEGLAGIKDDGLAFDQVRISPRWAATEEREVAITAKYEASGGYVAYRFFHDTDCIRMDLTGNASAFTLEILLPDGKMADGLSVNGITRNFEIKIVERSVYVLASIPCGGVHSVKISFASTEAGH